MPLTRNRDIFTPKWVERNKKVVEAAMTATVMFYDPKDTVSVLVGKSYQTTITPLLENIPARIQPVRASVQKQIAVNGTEVQNFTFQMPIEHRMDLRTGVQARVTASPLNPDLMNYVFVLKESADSSNPFEWTLGFESDMELVDHA